MKGREPARATEVARVLAREQELNNFRSKLVTALDKSLSVTTSVNVMLLDASMEMLLPAINLSCLLVNALDKSVLVTTSVNNVTRRIYGNVISSNQFVLLVG